MEFKADTILTVECNVTTRLAETAAKIAFFNFDWHHTALIVLNTTIFCGVETFVKMYPKNIKIGYGVFSQPNPSFITQYVLFVRNNYILDHMLSWMESQQYYNIGKYLVLCYSETDDDCDEDSAMQILWDYKVVNVVYLRSQNYKVIGYTYYFKEGVCRNGPAVQIKSLESNALNLLFSPKLWNLYKCPLVVSAFRQRPYMFLDTDLTPSGSDGDLLILLMDALNATLRLMTPKYGFGWGSLENGTWTGSLGDVFYDWANFSMTSNAITFTRYTHFHLSTDYNVIHMAWFSSFAGLKPAYLKLLIPFKKMTHLAVISIFMIVVASAIVLKSNVCWRILRRFNVANVRSSIVFYSWLTCMGLPSHKLPEYRPRLIIVFIWIWYCFLIRTFYQACLIGALKSQLYEKEFESIEDVLQQDYDFGGVLALRDYYIDNPVVFNNWKSYDPSEIPSVLLNISRGMKFALATNLAIAQGITKDNDEIRVHAMSQGIVSSPVVIFYKKFSPLVQPMNQILKRLVEAGFPSKLYKDYASRMESYKLESTNESINTGHFTGCYVILATGWFVSTLIFVLEIMYAKKYKSDK